MKDKIKIQSTIPAEAGIQCRASDLYKCGFATCQTPPFGGVDVLFSIGDF